MLARSRGRAQGSDLRASRQTLPEHRRACVAGLCSLGREGWLLLRRAPGSAAPGGPKRDFFGARNSRESGMTQLCRSPEWGLWSPSLQLWGDESLWVGNGRLVKFSQERFPAGSSNFRLFLGSKAGGVDLRARSRGAGCSLCLMLD